MTPAALLIAGPTASGKSAAAISIARAFGATIVNADSMQVYKDLRILTARPTPHDETAAPHALYGMVDGATNFSTGLWARAAGEIVRAALPRGPLFFVGGTGLYFRALTGGLSPMPDVPPDVRARVRMAAEARTSAELHASLIARDPHTAARLRLGDRQRIIRALEVFEATGAPLAMFQTGRGEPVLGGVDWAGIFLAPERGPLHAAIDARFCAMLRDGAIDEVEALIARGLDPALPVMRAHGAPHLADHLAGRLTLAEAAERAKRDTRHYVKRQFTWARHQMSAFAWIAPQDAVEAGSAALQRLLRRPADATAR
jgi:tRNA dimethylallyltransferase